MAQTLLARAAVFTTLNRQPPPPSTVPPQPPCAMPETSTELDRWFAQEIHPHGGQLKAWLRGSFPGVRDVDDVVQESYLRAWKAKAARPIRSAKSFLFQIARNIAIDLLRREKSSPVNFGLGDLELSSVADDRPDAAAALSLQEKLDLLADALLALPPRCREVVFLHKIRGLAQREVAQKLAVSERTVENHTREGMIRLQRYMHGKGIKSFTID